MAVERAFSASDRKAFPARVSGRFFACLAPGIYVYRLAAGEFAAVRKMVVFTNEH